MFVLFSFLFFIFSFLTFYVRVRDDWRRSFLAASLLWGLAVVLSTEILSLLHWLSFGPVIAFWMASTAGAFYSFWRFQRKEAKLPRLRLPAFSAAEIFWLSGIAGIVALTGLTAIIAPPNTWDSMTYHMSRVAHWAQDHSVASYPTSIQRQLYQPPFAEFVILQLQILVGGDRFANMVQWFSMAGSLIGVSLIAQMLGGDRRAQIFTSLVAATLPMGILQASSTQNDYVAAFWLVCLVYYVLALRNKENFWQNLAGAALSFALGVLTKGTVYLFALPFLAWGFSCIIKYLRKRWGRAFVLAVVIILAVNAGHYLRSKTVFGSFISSGEEQYAIKQINILPRIFNVIRHSSLHWGTPFAAVNRGMTQGVYKFYKLFGLNAGDVQTTEGEYLVPAMSTDEDLAGNLLHVLFIAAALGLCLGVKEIRRDKKFIRYTIAVVGAALLFCFFIKWWLFYSRLHLPVFLLLSVVVGLVIARASRPVVVPVVAGLFLLSSGMWVFFNATRPLLGKRNIFNVPRMSQYFSKNSGFIFSYAGAVNEAATFGCSQIGLVLGGDSWEYPLFALFHQGRPKGLRIEHVEVKNLSSDKCRYPLGDFHPCVIISDQLKDAKKIVHQDAAYLKTRQFAFLDVFVEDKIGTLGKQSAVFHFQRAMASYAAAARVLQRIQLREIFTQEGVEQLFWLRTQSLEEARQIDVAQLNGVVADFGEHLQNDFIQGLSLSLEGLRMNDAQKREAGEALLLEWNRWLADYADNIKTVFEK